MNPTIEQQIAEVEAQFKCLDWIYSKLMNSNFDGHEVSDAATALRFVKHLAANAKQASEQLKQQAAAVVPISGLKPKKKKAANASA